MREKHKNHPVTTLGIGFSYSVEIGFMSVYPQLLRLLQKELHYQEKLLLLLGKEQCAIIKLNQEQMDFCRLEKESLISKARELDQQRRELLDQFTTESISPAGTEKKLSEIIAQCRDPQLQAQLKKVGGELNELVKAVRKQNDLNSNLINHSLGLVVSAMSIIRSQPGTELPTYSPAGRLTSQEEDPAFAAPRTAFTRSA